MPEKPPDDREKTTKVGIDRRDMLKGISIGAAGLAGAGTATSVAGAQNEKETAPCDFSIDYLVTTPEGAPVSDHTREFADGPTARMDVVTGITFEPADDPPPIVNDRLPMGYQLTIVTNDPPAEREIVTRAFEEYNAHAVATTADPDAGGNIQLRKTVSLNDLGGAPPNEYLAVLTLTDYRGPVDEGGPCCSVVQNVFTVSESGIGDAGGGNTNESG